jgi:nitroimidazol reductase NimA-like FMN-containing flavoprotein (pyridoxamine 5'-phosphate oxidase superfamily)
MRRQPNRAIFDRATAHAILDEGLICHLGFAVDGKPFVVPTMHWRDGDRLYVHGSSVSRTLRALENGAAEVCVTVTLLDGLVLARSAYHHSLNFRSVMVFGRATLVEGEEKLHALGRLVEHVTPGRWDEVRHPSELELKATSVLALPLEEVSVKVRPGDAVDDEDDYDLPVWAGVVPLALRAGAPEVDPLMRHEIATPSYLDPYTRPTEG